MSIRLACCSAGAFSIPGKAVASYMIVMKLSAKGNDLEVAAAGTTTSAGFFVHTLRNRALIL